MDIWNPKFKKKELFHYRINHWHHDAYDDETHFHSNSLAIIVVPKSVEFQWELLLPTTLLFYYYFDFKNIELIFLFNFLLKKTWFGFP